MFNIISAIKRLKEYLDERFTDDRYSLQYKAWSDPRSGEVVLPKIYTFTCPSGELKEAYPKQCPAIVITVDGHDDNNTFRCTAHTCVVYPSIADKEIAERVEGEDNKYVFKTTDDYSVSSDVDMALIESSILITEQLYEYLRTYRDGYIAELNVTMPAPTLPEFPFSTSSISFTISTNVNHVGQIQYDDLF